MVKLEQLEGLEYIEFFIQQQNYYYCIKCNHPAEWHGSDKDHWCQICRFENPEEKHSLEIRQVKQDDIAWQDYLMNMTGKNYQSPQKEVQE